MFSIDEATAPYVEDGWAKKPQLDIQHDKIGSANWFNLELDDVWEN